MHVEMKYGKEARHALLEGARKLNDAVRATLGPSGRNAIFRHMNRLVSTKDGITVAREINLPDKFESMGADWIRGAAAQTVDVAGDGTTTATLLAHAIFDLGCAAIEDGAEPVALVRGIERATKEIVGDYDAKAKKYQGGVLEKFAVPATPELAFQAARISSNGDDAIAKVVSEAVLKCGVDGALTIGNSNSQDHVLEIVEGMQIAAGMVHPYFVTDPQRNRCVYEEVTVLCLNQRLSTANQATEIMKAAINAAERNGRPSYTLILCDDVDPEALAHILHNRNKPKDGIPIVVVRTPFWADMRRDLLDDVAMLTGGKRIEFPKGKAFEGLTASDFGYAKRVVIDGSKTVLTARDMDDFYREKKFEPHIAQIQAQIDDEGQRPDQVNWAKTRLASLTGGVAVIKVGGTSVDAVEEAKFRVEDAIHATRAAVSDGVVPGGGSALLFAGCVLKVVPNESDAPFDPVGTPDFRGYSLLLSVLAHPLRQIADNAGQDSQKVFEAVLDRYREGHKSCGFDAAKGEYKDDMIASGIVDPLRVVRAALNAATSAAATTLLKTEVLIAHVD